MKPKVIWLVALDLTSATGKSWMTSPTMENLRRIRTLVVVSTLVGIASLNSGAQTIRLSRNLLATKRPVVHYHVVHGWPILPENNILDEVSAVAVDSHENVFVLQRG